MASNHSLLCVYLFSSVAVRPLLVVEEETSRCISPGRAVWGISAMSSFMLWDYIMNTPVRTEIVTSWCSGRASCQVIPCTINSCSEQSLCTF